MGMQSGGECTHIGVRAVGVIDRSCSVYNGISAKVYEGARFWSTARVRVNQSQGWGFHGGSLLTVGGGRFTNSPGRFIEHCMFIRC